MDKGSGFSRYKDMLIQRIGTALCIIKPKLPRTIIIGQSYEKFASNRANNMKYNFLITFLPMVLWEQFYFFPNLFTLFTVILQCWPEVQVTSPVLASVPLVVILLLAIFVEGIDEYNRWYSDRKLNKKAYDKLNCANGITVSRNSSHLKIGDVIFVEKGMRVPADLLLLRATEDSEEIGNTIDNLFIKTDQLDGETDWKIRVPVPVTQNCEVHNLSSLKANVYAEAPNGNINSFQGRFIVTNSDKTTVQIPLDVENTLWANTVVSSGTALGVVIYTGVETRASMHKPMAMNKLGLFDKQVNLLTFIFFLVLTVMVLFMTTVQITRTNKANTTNETCGKTNPKDHGFALPCDGDFEIKLFKYTVLLSSIIPISLLAHFQFANILYGIFIGNDKQIPGAIVRSSNICEELGRIEYLLSDKTGTLTKNEMLFKKLCVGATNVFDDSRFHEISKCIKATFSRIASGSNFGDMDQVNSKLCQCIEAISLCHNVSHVSPAAEEVKRKTLKKYRALARLKSLTRKVQSKIKGKIRRLESCSEYQASSADEVALIKWCSQVGMKMLDRDKDIITLQLGENDTMTYKVLHMIPFTSETKRMGVIVKNEANGEITFFLKGADDVMSKIVKDCPWLNEESTNLAEEGLRTLVFGKKILTDQEYMSFQEKMQEAKLSMENRVEKERTLVSSMEHNLELLCVTGVEDALQDEVVTTINKLRDAGIKIWMITGDKLGTAVCIAKSTDLFHPHSEPYIVGDAMNSTEAHARHMYIRSEAGSNHVENLVITGNFIGHSKPSELAELVCNATGVVCCRCSPEQKTMAVQLLQKHQKPCRVAVIGDGGNDVSMIRASHVGIGIVGKEGMDASLAADFSISKFCHLQWLLLVHGRHCYERSSNQVKLIIHRGIMMTIMQAVFCVFCNFHPVYMFSGWLNIAFIILFTSLPIISTLMDKDIMDDEAFEKPVKYKEISKKKSGALYVAFSLLFLFTVIQGVIIVGSSRLLSSESDSPLQCWDQPYFTCSPKGNPSAAKCFDFSPIKKRNDSCKKNKITSIGICNSSLANLSCKVEDHHISIKTEAQNTCNETNDYMNILCDANRIENKADCCNDPVLKDCCTFRSITFTSLVIIELVIVMMSIRTWHLLNFMVNILVFVVFACTIIQPHATYPVLGETPFLFTEEIWKVLTIVCLGCLPMYILKFVPKLYAAKQEEQ